MLRLRASALRLVGRAAEPPPVLPFVWPGEEWVARAAAAATLRCCSRNGRIPRTSRADSHCSFSCSVPPGRPSSPARRFAAGRCRAVTLTTVAVAPATPVTAPAVSAVPSATPKARSAPTAAAAATAVTSSAVEVFARRKASPSDSSPAAASSRARAYASYSAEALAASASSASLPRASSAALASGVPAAPPAPRRASSSTARPSSRSASPRWLSRIGIPLRELRHRVTSVLRYGREREGI